MNKPPWLRAAERDIGQRETLAPNDSPWIRRMWARVAGADYLSRLLGRYIARAVG
jgi:hypothetical protein